MIRSTSPDSNNTVANSCQLISVPWFSLGSQTTRPMASAETILGIRLVASSTARRRLH